MLTLDNKIFKKRKETAYEEHPIQNYTDSALKLAFSARSTQNRLPEVNEHDQQVH